MKKKVILVLLFFVCLTLFTGCKESDKPKYYDLFGGEQCLKGNYVGSDIQFDISTLYVTTRKENPYFDAAKLAIDMANDAISAYCDYSITYSTSKLDTDSYTIKTSDVVSKANAKNYNNTTGVITKSQITCYTKNMDAYCAEGKLHLLLHEIGHTLGLKDLENQKVKGYNSEYEKNSVMYYKFGNGYPTFTDYTEFDKQNLKLIYDND